MHNHSVGKAWAETEVGWKRSRGGGREDICNTLNNKDAFFKKHREPGSNLHFSGILKV